MIEIKLPAMKDTVHLKDGPVLVDDEPWYTVYVGQNVVGWLDTYAPTEFYWHYHDRTYSLVDVPEKLYMLMVLKWK